MTKHCKLPMLLLTLWMAGCASLQQPQVHGTPDLPLQNRLRAISHWQLEGKLAVRAPRQSDTARIQWQQDGEAFDIHLSGPAGLKATHIYGIPGGVRFEQGELREQAGSAEALSQKLIGWPLPATELTAWLRGLPSQHLKTTTIAYTATGLLSEIQQDDWRIRFSDYRNVQDVSLPGRIEAVRGDTRITLIIKQWQL